MKQEDKDLLLKDISARLPYGIKISIPDLWTQKREIEILDEIFKGDDGLYRVNSKGQCIEYIKPYLFPMSSITKKQKRDLLLTVVGKEGLKLFSVTKDGIVSNDKEEQSIESFYFNNINFSNETTEAYIDWLNKNHFDYRGLIEKELAIDATNLKIY